MTTKKRVPPDGGWGYVIVMAHALHHFVSIPIMQGFGLLYKDTFKDLGFTATDSSIIVTTNGAFSMFCGIINGPLLNRFGYRKVSIMGAIFTTFGVILTAFAYKFYHFIITYGLIASLGMGMGMSSYPLALNTYFSKKRSIAAGYTMTICGFGPVVMPQLITLFLYLYGVQGATILIGAIAGHTFISALLLQPISWHMKEEIIDEENHVEEVQQEKGSGAALLEDNDRNEVPHIHKEPSQSQLSLDLEVEAIYGIDTPLAGSVLSLYPVSRRASISRRSSVSKSTRWKSTNSLSATKYNSTQKINEEEEDKPLNLQTYAKTNSYDGQREKNSIINSEVNGVVEKVYNPDLSQDRKIIEKEKQPILKKILKNIVAIFDLTLLQDLTYVNIMLGMSLAVFAELNFSLLTPFIMADYDLTNHQIAIFMSLLSTADICFRFLAPYLGSVLKKPPRVMYLFSLFLLIMSRFSLLLFKRYAYLLGVAIFLGLAKGVRTVYWSLVIPSHVPIERLASALGLQYTVNGIFLWIGGPFLGYIRDLTGSYKKCIFVINFVTFTTIIMWTIELLYKRYKSKTNETIK